MLSENTSLLDHSTHPRAFVMTRFGVSEFAKTEPVNIFLAKHPSSIYTREKVELRVLFKIIKGAVLPLGTVWVLDVETCKMKRKIVF